MAFTDMIPFRKHRSNEGKLAARPARTDPFVRLHEEMNRLFDEFVAGAPERGDTRLTFPGGTWDFLPDVDVAETGKEMRVTVELPGVDEKDLDVRLDGDTLTIRGEKREETSERDGKWTHSECCYGSFVRSVPLGAEVDAGRVDATFKKGVLKIRLPKMKTSARDQGRIKVKAG